MIDQTKLVTGDLIPDAAAEWQDTEASLQLASQWKLMWWRFRKHKLALVSGILIICIYQVAAFVDGRTRRSTSAGFHRARTRGRGFGYPDAIETYSH